MEAELLSKYNLASEWMFFVFLTLFFILAWVRKEYPRRYSRLIKSFVSQQSMFQVMREELVYSHRASIALTFVFVFSASIFLTLVGMFFGYSWSYSPEKFMQFIIWTGFIVAVYLIRWIASGLFAFLIEEKNYLRTHLFLISINNKVMGLILLPLSLFAAYLSLETGKKIIYLGIALWALVFFYRILKEIILSREFKIPQLYFILYLCAFEISPIIIGIKIAEILNK
jgi:hypothetical protein